MKNTWNIISDFVSIAGSLEQAKILVAEEVAKGDCTPMSTDQINKRIEYLWAANAKASGGHPDS